MNTQDSQQSNIYHGKSEANLRQTTSPLPTVIIEGIEYDLVPKSEKDWEKEITMKVETGHWLDIFRKYDSVSGGINLINWLIDNYNPPFTKASSPMIEIKDNQCNVCGGEMVLIRGKYPGNDKRYTCPTCTCERLEQINEISSKNYGHTAKEKLK